MSILIINPPASIVQNEAFAQMRYLPARSISQAASRALPTQERMPDVPVPGHVVENLGPSCADLIDCIWSVCLECINPFRFLQRDASS